MSEPTRGPQSQQVRDAEHTTGVMRGIEQLDAMNARLDAYPVYPIDGAPPEPYVKERLFSRKVLIGWAVATLVVWFVFTMIVPVAVESAKEAIESSMKESVTSTAAPAVAPVPPVPPAPVAPVAPSIAPDQVKK